MFSTKKRYSYNSILYVWDEIKLVGVVFILNTNINIIFFLLLITLCILFEISILYIMWLPIMKRRNKLNYGI